MKYSLFLVIPIFLLVAMLPLQVHAQTSTPTVRVSLSPRPTRPVTTPQAQACEVLKNRVGVMIEQYKTRETTKVTKYNEAITLANALLDKLTTEGKDTTKAKSDLNLMQTKVTKLEDDFSAFVTKATAVQNLPCTNVSTYLAELQKARVLLRVVHQDVSDIQKFYNSVVRTDLLSLRNHAEVTGTISVSPRPSVSVTRKPSFSPTHFPPGPADRNPN